MKYTTHTAMTGVGGNEVRLIILPKNLGKNNVNKRG